MMYHLFPNYWYRRHEGFLSRTSNDDWLDNVADEP
jgi:hypothetical protein